MLRTGTILTLTTLLAGGLGVGCRPMERTMITVSRVKSPVTVVTPAVNRPFREEELLAAGIDPATLKAQATPVVSTNPAASVLNSAHFDPMEDLRTKDSLVVVCLSGGGARAARMAAHTLAELEREYNRLYPPGTGAAPLASRIDAWSTCSGGSIYASFAAIQYQRGIRAETFEKLAGGGAVRLGTQELGGMAALFYHWPFHFGYAPIRQVLTEWDTLDLFAHNLALLHEGGFPLLPFARTWKLGDLPARPRFYFNTTCHETAHPFIITQSVVHRDLSGDPLAHVAADPLLRWIADVPAGTNRAIFDHASTLEDLGSPPGRFPLAYAAMASAAFPGVFEPLALRDYLVQTNSPPWWRVRRISLADGGLYDNSGLTTAIDLFDFLRSSAGPKPQRLVLLEVDADIEPIRYTGPSPAPLLPLSLGVPLRGAASGFSSVKEIYRYQQRLVSASAHHHLRELAKTARVELFHIRLVDPSDPPTELAEPPSALDRDIERVDVLGLVSRIPTDFVVTDREDRRIKSVVERRLAVRAPGQPSLAERFARAVAGAATPPQQNPPRTEGR